MFFLFNNFNLQLRGGGWCEEGEGVQHSAMPVIYMSEKARAKGLDGAASARSVTVGARSSDWE
jgi:hypothetical protein